uniref:Myosin motor domain-containing protein n=1 Tax=Heterorhabditis bacteriophora TaxID=37862 RepID=A0A1I7XK43_HETBA
MIAEVDIVNLVIRREVIAFAFFDTSSQVPLVMNKLDNALDHPRALEVARSLQVIHSPKDAEANRHCPRTPYTITGFQKLSKVIGEDPFEELNNSASALFSYLPYDTVTKEKANSTKYHIVHIVSAPIKNFPSLNDPVNKGPV